MDERTRRELMSRRHFGKLALGSVPLLGVAGALAGTTPLFGEALGLAQAKPNSLINGVQLGTITYSYRSMPDQSAEATLRYAVTSGISAVELMNGPIWSYLGQPTAARGGGAGRAGAAAPAAAAGAAAGRAGAPAGGGRGAVDPATLTASWNGVACAPANEGGAARGAGGAQAAAPAAGAAGRGGRAAMTPEQQAAADQQAADMKKWRESLSMDKVKALRKMYNDAGVSIYATKTISATMSDDELDFNFEIARNLGATHTTLELVEDEAALKRLGDWGLKKGVFVAYHTHLQGNITAFDKAFAASKGNMANVDLGHYVAAGGDPRQFLTKFHDRIASFHLKDRTTPKNCALNLAWGTGETPIKELLQMVKTNKWKMPATIELEYQIPEGSDAVKEVAKCVAYCRQALA